MNTHPHPDPEPLHVQTQSLRAWVLGAAAILLGWVGRYLPRRWRIIVRRDIALVASDVRELIVKLALLHRRRHHRGSPRGGYAPRHPFGAGPGFRERRCKSSPWRHCKRRVRIRAHAILARIARLRDILSNLRVWIARMVARIATLKPCARLLAVAPPASIVRPLTAPMAACADTS